MLIVGVLSTFSATAHANETSTSAEGCAGLKASTEALTSPFVFNWLFYLQANNDLARTGVNSAAGACAHWVNSGASEGRQAHPGFHANEYLTRYPDLMQYFGRSRPVDAVTHYVQRGMAEGRVGYLENHGVGTALAGQVLRGTISGATNAGPLYVSASLRTGGAIDSVMWRNVEFINSFDLGRELQIAFSRSGSGECYNPTEAGSRVDSVDPQQVVSSSSVLQLADQIGTKMVSRNAPAFWMRPGEVDPRCGPAQNQGRVASNVTIGKTVDIGYAGMPNVINFQSQVNLTSSAEYYLPSGGWSVAVEAPTGYMTGSFNQLYVFNPATQSLRDVRVEAAACVAETGPCEQSKPVIFATKDDVAMGVCAVSAGPEYIPPAYGVFDFSQQGSPAANTYKWNVVHRRTTAVAGSASLNFQTFIAIGTVKEVQVAMTALYFRGNCSSN